MLTPIPAIVFPQYGQSISSLFGPSNSASIMTGMVFSKPKEYPSGDRAAPLVNLSATGKSRVQGSDWFLFFLNCVPSMRMDLIFFFLASFGSFNPL